MPGIAQQPTQTIDPSAITAIGQDKSTVKPIEDLMAAFRSGFITVDDLTRRAQNKPVEESQRQTTLQANDLQRKQIAAENELLPGRVDAARQQQSLESVTAPARAVAVTKQARDLELLTTDPDAYHAEKTDEALRQAYIQRKGRLPEALTIKNPEKPLNFVEWTQQNLPDIQAKRDAITSANTFPDDVSGEKPAYETEMLKLNDSLVQDWQKYVRDSQTVSVPKGSPEYSQALHDEVSKMLEQEAIKGAKAKALPGILENQAKGTPPHTSTVKRVNPTTGQEEEVLVQTDLPSGQKIGETVLATSPAKLTESQANTQLFANRLGYNDKVLSALETQGFDPSAIGSTAQKFIPNRFRSEQVQEYTAAKDNWISAVLRKESGAAISAGEYKQANKEYFPQDGDSALVVKQKQGLRKFAEQQMHKISGPGGQTSTSSAPGFVGSNRVVQNGVTFEWNGTSYAPVQ